MRVFLLVILLLTSKALFSKNIFECENEDGIAGISDTDIAKCINDIRLQGGGELFFPAGRYNVSTPITIVSPGIILRGEGRGTKINYTGTDTAILFSPVSGGHNSQGGVKNLAIFGDASTVQGTAIKILKNDAGAGSFNMQLSGLWVKNFSRGLALERVFSSKIENTVFENAPVEMSNGGVSLSFINVWFRKIADGKFGVRTKADINNPNQTSSGSGQMSLSFIGSNFDAPGTSGQAIYVKNTWPLIIEGSNFENFSEPPIVLNSWGDGVIRNSSFVNVDGAAIYVESPANSGSSQAKTIQIQGLRAPQYQLWIDEGDNVTAYGRLLIMDNSIDLQKDIEPNVTGLQPPVINNQHGITIEATGLTSNNY